jgi:predicted RNase H-like HicB family nuclease
MPTPPFTIRAINDLNVDIEREEDGRLIGEVVDIPGVLVYGSTPDEAVARAKALALRVLADRLSASAKS